MNICVLDGYAANPGDLSWQAFDALGTLKVYDRTAPGEIVSRLADTEIALTNKVVISARTMDALPRLKYIGVLATGYNVVDVAAARARGVVVTNIPAYSTDSVAQLVFAFLLNICQQVQLHSDLVHQGRWVSSPDFSFTAAPLVELAGKTMGLVGLGNIGQAVARIALAFGMKVLALTSKTAVQLAAAGLSELQAVDAHSLFSQSDVLSLHCPLTEETRSLVNARTLSWMKPTAILINTGRGGLIDEAALAAALADNRLAAAGLDVLSTEPPRADNPLLTAPHCYITPHLAWASVEARRRLIQIAADNVLAFLSGKPINLC